MRVKLNFSDSPFIMPTPPSPGQVLLEDYLKPMGISEKAMARAIGVSAATIRAIVSGKRSITPLMSIRIGTFFGHYEDYWHGLQVECDFHALRARSEALTRGIRPASELMKEGQ
jgi:addiction module HigA family antidote